jgi:hypothetical protein
MISLSFMAKYSMPLLYLETSRRAFRKQQCSSFSERKCRTYRVITKSSVLLVSSSQTFANSSSRVLILFSSISLDPRAAASSSNLRAEKRR